MRVFRAGREQQSAKLLFPPFVMLKRRKPAHELNSDDKKQEEIDLVMLPPLCCSVLSPQKPALEPKSFQLLL